LRSGFGPDATFPEGEEADDTEKDNADGGERGAFADLVGYEADGQADEADQRPGDLQQTGDAAEIAVDRRNAIELLSVW
jgi:hypothetical protein